MWRNVSCVGTQLDGRDQATEISPNKSAMFGAFNFPGCYVCPSGHLIKLPCPPKYSRQSVEIEIAMLPFQHENRLLNEKTIGTAPQSLAAALFLGQLSLCQISQLPYVRPYSMIPHPGFLIQDLSTFTLLVCTGTKSL